DGLFHLAARGLGQLDTRLDAGIYKVKARAGFVLQEEYVHLVDQRVQVDFPRLPFSSAAPLTSTAKTHEYHVQAAAEQSREVHVRAGAGAWIFVFARDWTASRPGARSAPVGV